jgi:hypothetical protein
MRHLCICRSREELRYINKNIRGIKIRLKFAVQLKSFQRLGYFPKLTEVPIIIIDHIKKCLGIFNADIKFHYEHDTTFRKPYMLIRIALGVVA